MHLTWLLALAACKGGPATGVGPGVLEVEIGALTDGTLDFGEVPEGGSETLTVMLSNAGTGQLEVLSVGVSRGDRRVWSVDWNRQPVLAAGASLAIEVTFEPNDPGEAFGAEIQVRTDQVDPAGIFIPVFGTSGFSEEDGDGDGFSVAEGDCNDGDGAVFPGANERCNGVDDDCDGSSNGEQDADGDGVRLCADDCDDEDSARAPGLAEICDDIDNDCDGIAADHLDSDGDGFSVCDGDCDDSRASAAPGAVEACLDGVDNDCDGVVDSIDADEDGHDRCGDGADCDDTDADVFPSVVSEAGDDTAAGTLAAPLATTQAGVDAANGCPVYLLPGTHGGATTTAEIDLRGVGAGVVLSQAGTLLSVSGGSVRNLTLMGADDSALRSTGDLEVRDVVFSGNTGTDGGGLRVASGTVSLTGTSSFHGNSASHSGGAVYIAAGALILDLGDTDYLDNTAPAGGAVFSAGQLVLTDSVFRDNEATHGGGAIDAVQADLFASVFVSNSGGSGGAVRLEEGVFRNNLLQENGADIGGGLWTANADVYNNTFVGNDATTGAALAHRGSGEVIANLAHFNTGDGGFHTDQVTLESHYNTVFGTAGGDYVGPWLDGIDNRSENPDFLDFSDDGNPDNDVLILTPFSPSVDSGSPDPAFQDADGTQNDRGFTGGPGAP